MRQDSIEDWGTAIQTQQPKLRTQNSIQTAAPPLALLAGAIVWGLIWYPYRLLEQSQISGAAASLITYGLALTLGLVFFHRVQWRHGRLVLVWIALTAGWTNLGYILATLHGEVMRVLLLFYLAPLWTVIFSRVLLNETLNATGALVIALSLSGAMVMLWQPAALPLPENAAEWIGLSAGFTFALSNVLARKAHEHDAKTKSLAVFIGVAALALPIVLAEGASAEPLAAASVRVWGLLIGVGFAVFVINVVVQYGLAHTTANRAIVILLFEVVVAAIAAYLLAGETMELREWVGGAMIAVASLFSGRLEKQD
jgi:drug/metabolite transporter (DMT)-like permease